MKENPLAIAKRLLQTEGETLEVLQIHQFPADDFRVAHDDNLQRELEAAFTSSFKKLVHELEAAFGKPSRIGTGDVEIPLSAFRSAVWLLGDKTLFAAASHEDRELPFLLVLGTV